ncbi:uncharacterized protein DS421_12g360120 [Arachis hypogaea]|nr:uncharacterized protein DS421_12g360120 [Arachis hypogaea]
MSKVMLKSSKAARKLAYANEKAWRKCYERVGFMIQTFDDEMGTGDSEDDSGSEFNVSDD